MKRSRLHGLCAASLMLAGVFVCRVDAVNVNYTDVVGATVLYDDIRESSDEPSPLYGQPVLDQDDTILFPSINFVSTPGVGNGTDLVDGLLRFTLRALENGELTQLQFEEWGRVTLSGSPTNQSAFASVFAPLRLTGIEVTLGGSTQFFLLNVGVDIPFTGGGDFSLADDGPLTNAPWYGSYLMDIDQHNPIANPDSRVTAAFFALDNTLSTSQSGGGFASISKDAVRITVPEANVFILSSIMLLGSAALAVKSRRWL